MLLQAAQVIRYNSCNPQSVILYLTYQYQNMSLDNIQLPPFIIQELFKNSLVQLNTEQENKPLSPVSAFNTLGNNRSHILIIVDNNDALYLPDEQLNFLMEKQ